MATWWECCREIWVVPWPVEDQPKTARVKLADVMRTVPTNRCYRSLTKLINRGTWDDRRFKGVVFVDELEGIEFDDLLSLGGCGQITSQQLSDWLLTHGIRVKDWQPRS